MMLMPDQTASDQSVKLERERFGSLINSMGDGVIAIDEHFKIVDTNGAALNILDVNTPLIGKSISSVLELVDKKDETINVHQTIRDIKATLTSREWRLKLHDGEKVNLDVSIAPVHLGYGRKGTHGYILIIRDITREKSLEEERDEFISVASHELRTPVAVAEGNISNAQLLFKQAGLKHKTVEEALAQAHNQIIFLSEMIDDLAMLARAERGTLTTEIESINVSSLIQELVKTYEPQAETKKLKLKTEIDPSLELLRSSRLYVKEILQNFITNAIKYTEKGHVTFGARQRSGGVEFYVSDTGIGISKSDQKRLFEKFFRSEDYHTRQTGGTGLGLYITQKLARLLFAQIGIESQLGHGSTFNIFIPDIESSKS